MLIVVVEKLGQMGLFRLEQMIVFMQLEDP
jgi:hypothetical protein